MLDWFVSFHVSLSMLRQTSPGELVQYWDDVAGYCLDPRTRTDRGSCLFTIDTDLFKHSSEDGCIIWRSVVSSRCFYPIRELTGGTAPSLFSTCNDRPNASFQKQDFYNARTSKRSANSLGEPFSSVSEKPESSKVDIITLPCTRRFYQDVKKLKLQKTN